MGPRGQSTAARGKAAELRFMQMALEHGWEVAAPVTEDSSWDVLVDRGTGWEKVQVKRAWAKDGHLTVNLVQSDGTRYAAADADWLAAVDVDTGRVWFVPWRDVYSFTRKRLTADMESCLLWQTPRADEGDNA